jgi:outer membrane lipoprotein carrier protein
MRLRIIAFTGLLLGSLSVPGQDAGSILRAFDAHYNHLQSLQARYTEHYTGMGMDRTETGTLLLKKPGRMSWLYDNPPGKVFLLDGSNCWFYTPGDSQAQRISAKRLDDLRSPLRFLLGHTQLARELEHPIVTPLEGTRYEIVGGLSMLGRRVQRLALVVRQSGQIDSLRLVEQDGTETTFVFTQMRENLRTSQADFRFVPPPGVTVVDGPPPI